MTVCLPAGWPGSGESPGGGNESLSGTLDRKLALSGDWTEMTRLTVSMAVFGFDLSGPHLSDRLLHMQGSEWGKML